MWATHNIKLNLIKNPCALEDLKHWTIDKNGGDGWKVEDFTGDHGEPFPNPAVSKYFVTSFGECKKSQLIDLEGEGYSAEIMDKYQPTINVTDWFTGRDDCGCEYDLVVRLLSRDKKTIKEFRPQTQNIEKGSNCQWRYLSYSFSNYGCGVRYVYFQHGGKDTQFWKGWYGSRVTNSSVTIDI